MDLNNRIFRAVSNSDNGQVNEDTLFYYHQEKEIVWGEYRGGAILFGNLLARMDEKGNLEMFYQHLDVSGKWRTGKCFSRPEVLISGKIRYYEEWQWTCDDFSKGSSIIEEV